MYCIELWLLEAIMKGNDQEPAKLFGRPDVVKICIHVNNDLVLSDLSCSITNIAVNISKQMPVQVF